MHNNPELEPAEEATMIRTRLMSPLSRTPLAAACALFFALLCGASEARAQWTTPDASGNINNTNTGNVGVGTTTPTNAKVQIDFNDGVASGEHTVLYGSRSGTSSGGIKFGYRADGTNTTGGFIRSLANLPFFIGTTGAPQALTLSDSGNLGIGTTNPSRLLELAAPSTNTQVFMASTAALSVFNTNTTANNTADIAFRTFDSAGTGITPAKVVAVFTNRTANASGGDLSFVTMNAGTAAERMRVTANGNVGIGTANPLGKLHVVDGNHLLVSTTPGYASTFTKDGLTVMANPEAGYSSMVINSGHSVVTDRGLLRLFRNDGISPQQEMLYVRMDGRVGLGTLTPGYRLDVQGGQVNASGGLCIAGDCKTAWSQVGGGTSQWTTSGTNVYYNSGNVGIGTASPVARLHVGGQADNLFSITSTGSGATDTVASFNSAVGNIMAVRGNGNVGIGTGSPGSSLEVRRDQATGTEMRVTNANAAGFAGLYLNSGFGQTAGGFVQWNNTTNASNMFVATGGAAPLYFGTNNAIRMTVMPTSGNVGIGTSTPGSKLFVGGGTAASGPLPGINVALGGDSYVSASNGTINTFIGSDISSYGVVGTLTNHPLGLRANNTLAMTVMPSGNVGIGMSSPAQKLDVAGNVNASGLCLGGDCKTAWSQIGGGTSSQWTTSGTSVYYNSGNVGIGTAAPAAKLHVTGGTRVDGTGNVYLGVTAAAGARGLEFVEESATTFSIRHHDPGVAWRNLSLNPYAGNVGVNNVNPIAPLTVGDSSSDNSDGYIVLGKKNSVGMRQMRMGYDANFNFVIGDYGHNNTAGTWVGQFSVNWQAPSNSLIVNSAGNVGVGTANPAVKLDVAGAINASGAITGATVSATYQDVAEWVPSSQKLAPGTVVILDAGKTNHVIASGTAYDTKVAGVVSAEPGVILGVGGDDKLKVATTGRVKVKVDASRGAIKVGDLLVTSEVEGVAMKSVPVDLGGVSFHRPGTIIGKALEPLEKGTGEILVLLSLQ